MSHSVVLLHFDIRREPNHKDFLIKKKVQSPQHGKTIIAAFLLFKHDDMVRIQMSDKCFCIFNIIFSALNIIFSALICFSLLCAHKIHPEVDFFWCLGLVKKESCTQMHISRLIGYKPSTNKQQKTLTNLL